MDFQTFEAKYLLPFDGLSHIFDPVKGYIVWRAGTGNNTELLHIRAFEEGKGYAKELIGEMLKKLAQNPPYVSVFGFALSSRAHLRGVYTALGFNVSADIDGVYKEPAFIFSQTYAALCERYAINQ